MTELVRYIVAALVEHPEAVEVSEVRGEHSVVVELTVHPDDLGRVLGRQGRTASAIRALLSAAATKAHQRVVLEILEEDAAREQANVLPDEADGHETDEPEESGGARGEP